MQPRRLARRVLMLFPVAMAVWAVYVTVSGGSYGHDFHGGMWHAGQAILRGSSPYPQPDAHLLLRELYAFIPPPLLALLAVPFSLLPWTPAVILWNLVCVGSLVGALYVVGVRDWRLYPLAVCSLPFVSSLGFGQTEGPLALMLAAAWRWRDCVAGPVALGALIAAKLLAWPLVLWLVLTRRIRAAGWALVSAASLLALSWAVIGFKGLSGYPGLLVADAHAFETKTHSVVSLLVRTGASPQLATVAAILGAAVVAVVMVRRAGPGDLSLFVAALAFSLLASPLLEIHYLTLVLIPLAIARPRLDALWLLAINVYWLSPSEPPRAAWQIAAVLAATVLILMRGLETARPGACALVEEAPARRETLAGWG